MPIQDKSLKVCSCNRTMPLDGADLAKALGLAEPVRIHHELCRREIGSFEGALRDGRDLLVGCTQEAPLFLEVADQVNAGARVSFVNIREHAGWSAQAKAAQPKIAALLAAAALPEAEPVPTVSYRSEGRLLIVGAGAEPVRWAERLQHQFDLALLLTSTAGAELPADRRYPVYSGRLGAISGWLGAFEARWEQANPVDLEACTRCGACVRACPEQAIDAAYQIDPDKCRGHRQCVAACGEIRAIDFQRAETGRSEQFDLVLDLSAQPALSHHQLPQGYFAPGADPAALAAAVYELGQLVGEFEKPRFFQYREKICAHSRSEIEGCSSCISVCSAHAIAPDGDHIRVEPHLCAGCGACTTVCPSGALGYAYPSVADMGRRIRTLLQTYRAAGGKDPVLLFHNAADGRELLARLGRRRGLPANVIPVETFHVASVGIDLLLGAFALGASQCLVLSAGSEAPQYLDMLPRQMDIAEDILAGLGYEGRHFRVVRAADASALEAELWALKPVAGIAAQAGFNLFKEKRASLDFAIDHLVRHAPKPVDIVPLAAGAPFGSIEVNRDACTLCKSCIGACPENALMDTPEHPRLKFVERNCVQCGLCARTCPESAITLTPRLLTTADARRERVLAEAEIFHCIRCGKPMGTKQLVDTMLARMSGHAMFAQPGALDRLKMCADCRVVDLYTEEKPLTIMDVKP